MDNSSWEYCVFNSRVRHIIIAWSTVYLLFLPVFLLVLYMGFNKWRRPQSAPGGGLSHSDFFTLNMVSMEMANLSMVCVLVHGYHTLNDFVAFIGREMVYTTVIGQMLFHSLTSVERYLAVVRPVTYMRLKGKRGVIVRNISIAAVWVFSLGNSLVFLFMKLPSISAFVLSMAPMPLVSYWSISVICVLTRPKPGEKGGNRKQTNQSKRSTIYTMAVILGTLLLRLVADMGGSAVSLLSVPNAVECIIVISCAWSILPSSLVLPLLFLQRAGKLSSK